MSDRQPTIEEYYDIFSDICQTIAYHLERLKKAGVPPDDLVIDLTGWGGAHGLAFRAATKS